MKKILYCTTAALIGAALLTGCGSTKEAAKITVTPGELAKQLAEGTVTSDSLTEVSAEIMASTLFVDLDQVTDSSAYMSTGATVCEIVVVECSEDSYTEEVKQLFENRVENQTTLYSSYDAEETTKLEAALIRTAGQYAVLCVCDDTDAAESILKDAGF